MQHVEVLSSVLKVIAIGCNPVSFGHATICTVPEVLAALRAAPLDPVVYLMCQAQSTLELNLLQFSALWDTTQL
jgi:hypothetical protein